MAYGHTCPVCGARVDNSEYNFLENMCEECAELQEYVRRRESATTRLLSARFEQIRLEV